MSAFYFANRANMGRFINRWDFVLLCLLLIILCLLAWGAKQMATPYHLGVPLPISLDKSALPVYALRTVLRLFIALCFSLLFTFTIGTLAAKNQKASRIIIPAMDILQSVPVLSILSITVTGFMRLFPGSLLGPECASIFAIFTAQVWNMAFGFYQSLKTVPADLKEACNMLHLSAWQRFWKLEVPFSMSSLLWNMMVSMSASWFFVVLSEAISVSHQSIRLPGIGSYIAVAIANKDLTAIGYAIITMMIVIMLYNQLFFRPLLAWSEKFKMTNDTEEEIFESWLMDWLRQSRLIKSIGTQFGRLSGAFVNARLFRKTKETPTRIAKPSRLTAWWDIFFLVLLLGGAIFLVTFTLKSLSIGTILHVCLLGAATATRVIILIVLSSLVWVPVGVFIGLHPFWAKKVQGLVQFMAAFPANLFYPLFVVAILTWHLNVEIWLTPLMILGTQWYILFNVIAGAASIPRELYLAADNFGLRGFIWWKRLALPAIFPYYITGAITAAGGAWNASIVAEWVSFGDVTLQATGLGAYIQKNTLSGNFSHIALGTGIMCLYVLAFNHLLWRPLYRLAETRFRLS